MYRRPQQVFQHVNLVGISYEYDGKFPKIQSVHTLVQHGVVNTFPVMSPGAITMAKQKKRRKVISADDISTATTALHNKENNNNNNALQKSPIVKEKYLTHSQKPLSRHCPFQQMLWRNKEITKRRRINATKKVTPPTKKPSPPTKKPSPSPTSPWLKNETVKLGQKNISSYATEKQKTRNVKVGERSTSAKLHPQEKYVPEDKRAKLNAVLSKKNNDDMSRNFLSVYYDFYNVG